VKSKSAVSKGAIYGPNGDVLAEAEGVLLDVPESLLTEVDFDALGWKIYGDEEPAQE
jgi:hypothetical protein